MKIRNLFLPVAFLLAASHLVAQTHTNAQARPAATSAPQAKLPSQQTVESFLHVMFGYDPARGYRIEEIKPSPFPGMAELDIVISQGEQNQLVRLYLTPDGEHAITGEVMPFAADPYLAMRHKLEKEAKGPSRGAKDNSLLLVEFSDLQCPHCKAAQPVIARLLEDFPKARFVFENFPLQVHPWAFKAAAYAHCIGQRDQTMFFKFVDLVFDNQGNISPQGDDADAILKDLAKQAGADPDQAAQCAASGSTAADIEQSLALGRELGIQGTPTLYVNGRPVEIGSLPYDTLKAIVAFDAVR